MIRRLMTSCIVLLLSVSVWADGIRTAADLIAFSQALAHGEATDQWRNDNGEVCLEADIDMTKAKKFKGIPAFKGVFDGKGHRIMNWKASGPLFVELAEGEVRDIIIDGSCSMKIGDGNNVCGFIAAVNRGLIENCVNYGRIDFKSTLVTKNLTLGGLVGNNLKLVVKCRNYGDISADCISTAADGEKPNIVLGGIAGRNSSNARQCASVAWCENHGKVSYVGDLMYDSVGGIIGNGNVGTVKFCINRGEVVSNASGNGWDIVSRCGGIVGFAKGDVVCCDNFGAVSTSGNGAPNTGGVVGMMNDADVVLDCVNYGPVRMSNESAGAVGGVCATVSRAARVKSCINRGEVIYEGASFSKRTSVGGVVGHVYNKKDAVTGAYVRDCANYGNVRSGNGGNRFEDERAIHTGGIVGYMRGSADYPVILRNCTNAGSVEAAGGRSGNIAGACSGVKTGGEYVDEYARSATPSSDGNNVSGRVVSSDGSPVAGVMVSDGFSIVRTDGFGHYSMKSDLARSRFVYISIPAGYEIPVRDGAPKFFKRIARHEKAVTADFVLSPRAVVNDSYTMLMVADPQIRPYAVDGSAEAWRDAVAPDMEAYRASLKGECYSIDLGDLIYNYPVAYDDYMDVAATVNCPIFNVIGNHDYDQRNLYATELGTPYFNVYSGPENYSFNIGKIHYIVLNDIIYSRMNPKEKYKVGLEDATLEWLRQDLQYIPKETVIVLAVHGQLFKAAKYDTTQNPNYAEYSKLLADYAKVYCWAGHYHHNYGYIYAGKGNGLENVTSICVSRATGALRINGYLNSYGTPQGYMVVDVDGDDLKWVYKAVGKPVEEQMAIYEPYRVDKSHVAVSVWNWNEDWSVPEWWENGKKVCEMERWRGKDPAYVESIRPITDKYLLELSKPAKSMYMFRTLPTEGTTGGEVRVTDPFGNLWTRSITW